MAMGIRDAHMHGKSRMHLGHRGHPERVIPEVRRQQSAVRGQQHIHTVTLTLRFVPFLYNVHF